MPTADSFIALGRGNGFPFCAPKQDVSGFTNWITLGGVSSGSASGSQINESLVNAMKLWWNLNSITGSFSASTTDSEENDLLVSATDKEVILKRFIGSPFGLNPQIEDDPLIPLRRACFGTSSFIKEQLQSSFTEEAKNDGAPGVVDASLRVGHNTFIVRMYNGSINDEDNFVGYGVSTLALFSSFASAHNVLSAVDITVGSYIHGTDDSGVDPDTGIVFDLKVFQTTLGGIPFRSKTVANAAGPGFTESLSTSELSGSASASSSVGNPVRTSSADADVTLSSIDFYTY